MTNLQDLEHHTEQQVKAAALAATAAVRAEEKRLLLYGARAVSPFTHFVRAVRAGWVAYITVLRA